MRTVKGTMYFNPLEGGIWAFEDEEGTRYQLDGVGADTRGEGRKITITGELDEEAMGIGMIYPIFKVESYTVEIVERPKKPKQESASEAPMPDPEAGAAPA